MLLVHFNVRSLAKNKDKIEEFLIDMTRLPDATAISQTKLDSNCTSNINIPRYNFLRCDSPAHAGGVDIYVKDTLQFRSLNDLSPQTPHCENLWLEVEERTTDIIIGVVYCHPGRNISSFQDKFHNNLLDLETNKLNYIVCEDFKH